MREKEIFEDVMLLALKMKDKAINQAEKSKEWILP